MSTRIKCEEEYSDKRLALGYRTCLDCGGREAHRISRARTAQGLKSMTPNHYEGSPEDLFDKPDAS